MKNLILLIAVVAAGWYGYRYLSDGEISLQDIPERIVGLWRSAAGDRFSGPASETTVNKCTTAGGEVFYGDIPEGIRCVKSETVAGSLTVVPAEVITGVNAPVRADGAQGTVPKIDAPAREKPPSAVTCEAVTRCSLMTSCDQVRLFAHHCGTWHVHDTDRVTCMKRWCEEDYYGQPNAPR